MSDIKLFRTDGASVTQLEGHSVALEKSLQTLIERHLDTFLGIRFLATEHPTGKTHAGRIDTLGIDENGCPCIIEYKRATNQNVINQGLYYLDWLLDHKAEFELLVIKMLGQEAAAGIEWSSPRLLCIAGDFTKYDCHAVKQINRNIELIRYVRYGEDFLLFDLVNAVQADTEVGAETGTSPSSAASRARAKTVGEHLSGMTPEMRDLYGALEDMCLGLGEDVQVKTLKFYVAFRRLKNFCTVEVRNGVQVILCFVKIDPDTVELEDGFTRDVRSIGHHGTGDLEITIRSATDLSKAFPFIQTSYEAS